MGVVERGVGANMAAGSGGNTHLQHVTHLRYTPLKGWPKVEI